MPEDAVQTPTIPGEPANPGSRDAVRVPIEMPDYIAQELGITVDAAEPEAVGAVPAADEAAQDPSTPLESDEAAVAETPLSRSERGKLIAELKQELEQERSQRETVEKQQAAEKAQLDDLVKGLSEHLGDQETYAKMQTMALDTEADYVERDKAALQVKRWSENRAFAKAIENLTWNKIANDFQNVDGLEGVNPETIKGADSFRAAYEHIYDAAKRTAAEDAKGQLDVLKAENDALKARVGGTVASPITGGQAGNGSLTMERYLRMEPHEARKLNPREIDEMYARERARAS